MWIGIQRTWTAHLSDELTQKDIPDPLNHEQATHGRRLFILPQRGGDQ
jgi:hypothetical protein